MKKIDNKAVVMTELNRELVRLGKLLPRTDAGKEALEVCEGAISNVTNERFKRDMIRYLKAKFPDHLLDEPCPKPVEVRTVNAKKTAHTPKPWAYEVSFDIDTMTDKLNLIGNGKILAQTIKFVEHPEADANARLIAASPDLLVALQDLLATIPFRENHNFAAIEAAYKAIAKATGGAE